MLSDYLRNYFVLELTVPLELVIAVERFYDRAIDLRWKNVYGERQSFYLDWITSYRSAMGLNYSKVSDLIDFLTVEDWYKDKSFLNNYFKIGLSFS